MTLRIIDTHVHWRDPGNNPYELLSDSVSDEGASRAGKLASSYLPQDYFNDAAGVDIVGFVHVEAEWLKSQPVEETRWLNKVSDGSSLGGRPLAIIGHADLSQPDVDRVLAAHATQPRIQGIRQILNYLPSVPAYCWADRDYLSDPRWRNGYARLAHYDLDFDLMCFASQMGPMSEMAAQHPQTRIHLEHTGMPYDHTVEGKAAWKTGMKALAAQPHVDVKVSGLGNTITDWTVEKIKPYVLDTIAIFGIERVTFASNFPTDAQFSSMAQIWDAFQDITSVLTPAERTAIFEENALRIYRLNS